MSALPPLVLRLLERLQVDPAKVVVLTFSADWQLQVYTGALELMGLQDTDPTILSTTFRDVCIGLSRLRGTHMPQLELPSGGVADLHLVAEATLFHAVLVDVRDSVEAARVNQQALQDAKLEAMARTRELVEARRKLGDARQRGLGLQRQLLVQQQASNAVRAQLAGLQLELSRELEQVSVRATTESGAVVPAKRALAASLRLSTLLAQLQSASALLQDAPPTRERLDLDQLAAVGIDAASQLARERGLGFELRLNRRSTETPLFNTALLRMIVCGALSQALLRTSSGRVDAQLRWDGSALKFEVTAPMSVFSEAERACLWDAVIADPAAPAQAALFALGALLRRSGGRATLEAAGEGEQRLTLSVPQAPRDGEVTERLFSGGRVWLLSDNPAQSALAQQRLRDLGFEVEPKAAADGIIEDSVLQPPDAILIDVALEDAVRLAFQLKGRGYRGRVLAMGSPVDSPVARASFDASVASALEPDALVRAIRGPGG